MVSHLPEPPSAPLLKQLLLSGNSWPCILVCQIFSSTPSYSSTSVHVRPHWVVCRCIFCMDKYLLVTFDILRPWPMLHQVRSSEVPHSASSLTLGSKMGWLLNDRWYFRCSDQHWQFTKQHNNHFDSLLVFDMDRS